MIKSIPADSVAPGMEINYSITRGGKPRHTVLAVSQEIRSGMIRMDCGSSYLTVYPDREVRVYV